MDIAVVGICFLVYISYKKKGLVSIVFQAFALVFSIVCAWKLPPLFSEKIYNQFLKTPVVEYLDKTLASIQLPSLNLEQLRLDQALSALPIPAEKLTMFSKLLSLSGVSLEKNFSISTFLSGNKLEQDIANPAIIFIVNSILSLVIFIVAFWLFGFLGKNTRILNKIPIVGSINANLGGCIGLVIAVVSIYVVFLLSGATLSMLPEASARGAEIIKNSFSYKLFSSLPIPVLKNYFIL